MRLVAPPVPTGVALPAAVATLLDGARGRMATVTAPAGFGKSAQVAAWAVRDGRRVAWIDLEPADNDPMVLVAAILEGLGHLTGSRSGSRPEALPADPALLVSVLGRAVRTCPTPFILVLDDVHLIDQRCSIDLVEVIARSVPPPSTLVLISRAGPSPALARVRVQRGLVDVTAVELALSPAEAGRMLEEMGVSIDAESVDQLVQDTEGWAVGVRLAGLALLAESERVAPLAASGVRHDREAADYLHEEWLRGMAAGDVELLTRASILEWLSGPLCDHVFERSDTAAALHRLHDTRRIVIPLDPRQDSYRMHRPLRDVLTADLQRTDQRAVRRCHHRASEWFESEGDADRAVHHALAAGELDRAGELVDAQALGFQMSGDDTTIARWIDAFPEGYFTSRPSLSLLAAVAALGDPERDGASVMAWLRTGEELLARTVDPDPLLARRFDAFRALVDAVPIEDALDAARRARAGLPPGVWHSVASLAHGALSYAVGEDEVAERMLAEAAAEAEVHGAVTTVAVSRAHLAVIHTAAGDLARATALVRSARALVEHNGLEQYPIMVLVTAMAAHVEAVEGNPDRACDEWLLARRSLTGVRGVAPWANIQSRVALARTSLLLSDRPAARTLMEEAESILLGQPEAVRPKAQLAEVQEMLEATGSKTQWTVYSLTTAELRVLHYLPTNLTLSDIADRLYVSRNTAKSHAASIYRKLGTKRRGEAVKIAEATGLITPSDVPPRM